MIRADAKRLPAVGAGAWRVVRPALLLAALVLTAAVGCAPPGGEIPEGPTEIGIAGRWVVARQTCPGECPPASTASRWIGATAVFTDTLVTFGDSECRAPTYRAAFELSESEESGSRDIFGFGSGRLVRIDCVGERWLSPAAVLVVESPEVVRAMWEGAAFHLERPAG